MKTIKLFLAIALSVTTLTATAQRGKLTITPSDTTFRIKTANKDITFEGVDAIKASRKYNPESQRSTQKWNWRAGKFAGINLFYNGLAQNIGTLSTPNAPYLQLSSKAVGVDINFFDAVIFSSGCFGIVTGLGIESNNFRFQKNISLTKDENGITVPDYQWTERGIELEKSKLTTTYLNVPLLFQFKFGNRSTFHIDNFLGNDNFLSNNDFLRGGRNSMKGWVSIGVVGGVRLQSYTKVKANEIGKIRKFGDYNLQNFHYGFLFSIGYGSFSVNAKYYPHSIFNEGYGPHVEQFNLGIGLVF